MASFRRIAESTDEGIVISDTPGGLAAIRRSGCAVAIWRRRLPTKFQFWINNLKPEQLPVSHCVLSPEMVCEALADVTSACGVPVGPENDLLVDDAAALSAIFADVMRAPRLRVSLEAVSGNASCGFHVDPVAARLVCTYRGAGTQYGVSTDGTDPSRVFSVPTGSPVIFRGTHWPETPISSLVHRSPPPDGIEGPRLVLVLDPVYEFEGGPNHHFVH